MRPLRPALATALLALLAVAAPAVRAVPPCAGPLACGADVDEALHLEDRMANHLHYGLALPVEYRTAAKLDGDVASLEPAWGDAGIWSGSYLAAESYRYAVARDHRHGAHADFWKDQQAQAKARIDDLLAQVDLRTYVARDWHPPVQPTVGGGTPPALGVGGVFPGEAGMMMFSCAPVDAPPGFAMARNSDVRGPFHWPGNGRPARLTQPAGDYVCEA
ncbi:MAG TPA: hypothetical protein VL281_04675, partial [Mycobacteriales bacterium]|nr:hypothetical protein [Mycobacteriales bacterium]